jgi:Fe2+ or Zn2+ uptake regulation protein
LVLLSFEKTGMVPEHENDYQMMTPSKTPRNVKSIKVVYDALHQLNHATAQDILDWINMSSPVKGTSLTSVYRALNHLVSTSQVKPLNFNDGQVRYELNSHQMHHHHCICTGCNQITMVDICPFDAVAEQLNDEFFIQYHNFEIFGLCQSCQVKSLNTQETRKTTVPV